MPTKKEERGTIHELDSRLAEVAQNEEAKPHTKKQIADKIKEFNALKLFPAKADRKKKEEIVKNLKLNNYNEQEIITQLELLKITQNFNRLIERNKIKIEDEIRGARKSGKNISKLEKIYKGFEEIEISIPKDMRIALNIHKKRIRLIHKGTDEIRNRIKYYSGQEYSFLVKDGFSRPTLIPEEELQKINQEGNVTAYMLDKFRKDVDNTYDKEQRKFSKSDPEKWKLKQKVFKKIYKALDHNLKIATGQKYNKKLVQRDDEGNIIKDQSEYPVSLKILDEQIIMYI